MSDLSDIRAEIAKARGAATAKIGRLRKKGIDLAGKPSDPRRNVGVQKNYTKAQAEKYLQELKSFNQRSNGFVRLADGYAPRSELNKLSELNRRYNAKGQRRYDNVKDMVLQNGETVAQRDAKLEVPRNFQRAAGLPNRRLYSPVKNNPQNIASPEALKKLIATRQKQLSAKYEPKEILAQRKEMMAMVKHYGDSKLTKAVRSLSNEQFKMLWNYGPFAADTSRGYERAKLLAKSGGDSKYDSVVEDAKEDILNAVNWAKENVHETPTRGRRKKAR